MDGRVNNAYYKILLLLTAICLPGLVLLNLAALEPACCSSLPMRVVSMLYAFVLI